jgi:SAM-dependent methyltransferase
MNYFTIKDTYRKKIMHPNLYHAHHQKYQEDIPFWQALASEGAGPVLELGCGTGRVLLPLQWKGLAVFGLDINYHMLAMLKAEETEVRVFQANLLQFHLGLKFSLIFLACNTWSTFPASERAMALEVICQHLVPGGVFAASLPNPNVLLDLGESEGIEPEVTITHPDTGNPVQVSSDWQVDQISADLKQVTFTWHYDHLIPDGQVERATYHNHHWAAPAQTYIDEFSQKGLIVRSWGDFTRVPYEGSSPYLIIAGKKL